MPAGGRTSTKQSRFESAMLPYLDDAHSLASWMTRHSPEAEDLVQEAYLKAFRYFDGFRGTDGRAWLLAIVRNTVLTWLRRSGANEPAEPFDEQIHNAPEPVPTMEQILVERIETASLRDCLEALPLEFRETIVMRELQELSYKDIAAVAGIPIGTVMSRLARARKRLLDCVQARAGVRR